MEWLTLSIAGLGSLLVMFVTPMTGLIVYIAALAWYPSFLTVKLGTLDFNVLRIVMLVLFLRLFLSGYWQTFKLNKIDKLVLLYFACQIVAGVTTTPIGGLLENRAGGFVDWVLPYFAIRIIINTRDKYLILIKAITFIIVPIALLGFYESVTGYSPFRFLKMYSAWNPLTADYLAGPRDMRMGFYRATVTLPQPIMFGLLFSMLAPPCAGLLFAFPKQRLLYSICLGIMVFGLLSSVSSGPVLSGLIAVIFMFCYHQRKYWKIAAIAILLMIVSVEIISNRHFYDVIGRFTFSSGTAWYRSKLLEVALGGGMSGHWLTGFGMVDPGWSLRIDGRSHTDIVNNYLLILAQYGLVGFIPFVLLIASIIMNLVKAFKAAASEADRWLIWTLASTMVGLLLAFFSVSLFAQTTTIFSILFGLCAVMDKVVAVPVVQYVPTENGYILQYSAN